MLIVPSSPSTKRTSSRCSGDALSASISRAILASCSVRRSRIHESFLTHLARCRGMTTGRRKLHFVHGTYRLGAGTKHLLKRLIAPTAGGALRRKDMRKFGLAAAIAASVAVTGCATYPNQYGYDPYGYNNGYYGQSPYY